MSRIDLAVPYSEKDEAKTLGARWDPVAKTWYAPDGVDPAPFKRWMPVADEPNIRAPAYDIMRSATVCWKCDRVTRVHGFLLTPPLETLEYDEDEDRNLWLPFDEGAVPCYVRGLPAAIKSRISDITRHVFADATKIVPEAYLMNHCEQCGAKLGDFRLIEESQAPLDPAYPKIAERMKFFRIEEPFFASVGGWATVPLT